MWAWVEGPWGHMGLGGGAVGPRGPGWRSRGAAWAWGWQLRNHDQLKQTACFLKKFLNQSRKNTV